MSLFKSFKRALGFPDDYSNDLGDISDLEDRDDDVKINENKVHTVNEDTDVTVQQNLISDEYILNFSTEIIDSVAFESDNREVLIASVSTTLSKQLPLVAERGRQEAENKYARVHASLAREINELRRQISESASSQGQHNDEQIKNLKKQIDELNKQIMSLEAEREQLQLENRYMADRIRGTFSENVIPTQSPDSNYKELIEENENLKKENSFLKSRLQEMPSAEEQEQFKKNIELQVEKFENILTRKESEIKNLRQEKIELTQECQKYANRIAVDDEKIDSLEKKVAELHKTIKTNLFDHATEQDKLNKEIKRLASLITDPDKQPKAPKKVKQKNDNLNREKPKEAVDSLAIDELMDNTEWFTAPEPGPRIKDPEVTENFGYKETVRKKSQKYDENQLTLF